MSLTLAYNIRHLTARRTTTLLTVAGIALVIFVFVASMMLAEGLRATLSATGSIENVLIVRTGAQNEVQSGINREHANIIISQPEVAIRDQGPLYTSDVVVLLSLKRRNTVQPSNVNIRGVAKAAFEVKRDLKMISGRKFIPGTQEIIVGSQIHRNFLGTEIGDKMRMAGTDWTVVGIFDGQRTAFDSEVWGDVEILMPAFKRDRFSSLTFRLKSGANFEQLKERLENDPRLNLDVRREREFYDQQSRSLSLFIEYLGGFVTVIFSLAAVVGCMITMHSAVANRRREIGVLRALGFKRANILGAFIREAVLLSLSGAVFGVVFSLLLTQLTISTTNFQTFSEVAFGFRITPLIALKALSFALAMGVIGALIPAWKASRIKIIEALRAR